MSCDNCYNGCPEPTPDRCVKYTGQSIPTLHITTNDPLSSVLNEFVIAILDITAGKGIFPAYDQGSLCTLIEDNLPCCDEITLNDVITATFKAICDINTRVVALKADMDVLNADYTIGCLENVLPDANTHDILQAVIDKLCLTADDLEALELDVSTNYVKKSEFNDLVKSYIESVPASTSYYNKMVPYTIVAFYPTDMTGMFDSTGAGLGVWEKIYLCNGDHGTPDLRGLVIAGATNMTGGDTMDDRVRPGVGGNPTYDSGQIQGENFITLNESQLASHSHGTTAVVNDGGHSHPNSKVNPTSGANISPRLAFDSVDDKEHYQYMNTDSAQSNITVSVAINPSGGDQPHPNTQPTIGMNYIMYIP